MKSLIRGGVVLLIVCVVPFVYGRGVAPSRDAFRIRVVNQQGAGLPGVRVISDTGIICYTQANGAVFFGEEALIGRDVQFQIGLHRTETIRVTRGGQAQIALSR